MSMLWEAHRNFKFGCKKYNFLIRLIFVPYIPATGRRRTKTAKEKQLNKRLVDVGAMRKKEVRSNLCFLLNEVSSERVSLPPQAFENCLQVNMQGHRNGRLMKNS